MKRSTPLLLGLATVLLPLSAHAVNYNVTSTADSGAGSLRQAIANANTVPSDDVITFAVGGPIVLTSGELFIADNGKLSISGPAPGVTIAGGERIRVFNIANGADVTLTSLIISGARLEKTNGFDGNDGNDRSNVGGGIFSAGTLSVQNCIIRDNVATSGAAIESNGELLTIRNSTISGNDGSIGAVIVSLGTTIIEGSTLSGNTAGAVEGGIFGDLTIRDSFIIGNNSRSFRALISSRGETLTVQNSTISGNIDNFGGIINNGFFNNANATVQNSTISGNKSGSDIISNFGDMTVQNSTISGNLGDVGFFGAFGGPAIGNSGNLTVLNSTISGNAGNGIYSEGRFFTSSGPQPATLNLSNSIVVGNSEADVRGTIDAGGNNIVGGTAVQAGLDSAGLKDNGGPTQTIALVPGSPAVNKGNSTLATDQRGVARPFGGAPDIGAFEAQFVQPTIVNLTAIEDRPFTFALDSFDSGFGAGSSGVIAQSVRLVSIPTDGTLTLNNARVTSGQTIARADLPALVFTPNADFNGPTRFSIEVADGSARPAASAIASLNVTPVNDAPSFAFTDPRIIVSSDKDSGFGGFITSIKAGPANERGQKLTFTTTNDNSALFSVQPTISDTGSLSFVTAPGVQGVAKVSTTLRDDGGTENGGVDTSITRTFTITVKRKLSVTVSLSPQGPFTRDIITATPLVANVSGASFRYTWFVNGLPVGGSRNTFDLSQPGQGDKGDRVSVTVEARTPDGSVGEASNFAIVRNSNPVAFSNTATVKSGAPILIPFQGFGNDPDGDALTFKRVGGPTNGTGGFETQADGSIALRYQSRAGFSGVEVIRFVSVDDEGRTSNIATLSIRVTGGDPTAQDAEAATQSGVSVDVPLSGNDPGGDPVTFKRVGGPRNGTGGLVVLPNGSTVMRYTPRANFVGTEEIRFVALNAAGRPSAVATIRIAVSASGATSSAISAAPSAGGS